MLWSRGLEEPYFVVEGQKIFKIRHQFFSWNVVDIPGPTPPKAQIRGSGSRGSKVAGKAGEKAGCRFQKAVEGAFHG
jgi:hypothetical protein